MILQLISIKSTQRLGFFGYRQTYKLRVPNLFMKIMKSVDKTIGETTYYKYKINLPKKIIEENDFLEKNLKVETRNNKIIISLKN